MGKLIWKGWQTSVADAPQPTSILYGENLRKSLKKESQKTQQRPQPEPTRGESPSQTQGSLELEAAAMRLKLEQNRKAQQEQGLQSASDKIKQINKQKK